MESLLRLKVSDVEECYRKLPPAKERSLVQGKLHPRYSALLQEGEAWAKVRIAPLLSKAAMGKLRSNKCAALACYMWPHAEEARALTLVKFAYWIILFDDLADDPLALGGDKERLRRFCCHFLHAVFGSGDPQTMSGFTEQELLPVELGREWWGEMTRVGTETTMPLGQQTRVAEAVAGYVMAQLPCVELRAAWEGWLREAASTGGAPPCTLEELVKLWRVSSSSVLILVLTEYELGIELDEESLASPLLQPLMDAVCDQWNWINNLFSLPKDLVKHEILNFVALLHVGDNMSRLPPPFHASLAQAWSIAADLERECIDLAARISQHQPALRNYAEALCTSLGSHVLWCQQTARYPGTDHHDDNHTPSDGVPLSTSA